jgi:uncharacterized protein (DUF58 family)
MPDPRETPATGYGPPPGTGLVVKAGSGRAGVPARRQGPGDEALFRSRFLLWLWRVYQERLTRAGRFFFWPSLFFLGFGAVSLELQAYVPFAYAFGIWAVAFVAAWLWRPRVRLEAAHATRVCAGETLPVDLEVHQQRRFTGYDLHVLPRRLPSGVRAVPDDGFPLPVLRRNERCRGRLGVRCERRGQYRLSGFRVETDFPFGLYRTFRDFPSEKTLLVYPRFAPLARLLIPTGRRYQPGGVALASVLGDSTEYVGNREYREGDSLRDMDWRATARLARPIVREYREEYFLRAAVILDTHVPPRAPAARREGFERAVSLCAAIGDYLARQEYLVDLFAAGPNLYHLMAGRSLAYLDQILDLLACVEENPAEPFEVLEPELRENLAHTSAVVCVFLDWTASRRRFLLNLRQQGVGIKAVIVSDAPCALDPAADAPLFGPLPVFARRHFDAGIEEL